MISEQFAPKGAIGQETSPYTGQQRKPPPIQSALEELSRELIILESATEVLRDRLNPVLTPARPTPESRNHISNPAVDDPSSAFHACIRNLSERVVLVRLQLNNIFDNLEM